MSTFHLFQLTGKALVECLLEGLIIIYYLFSLSGFIRKQLLLFPLKAWPCQTLVTGGILTPSVDCLGTFPDLSQLYFVHKEDRTATLAPLDHIISRLFFTQKVKIIEKKTCGVTIKVKPRVTTTKQSHFSRTVKPIST